MGCNGDSSMDERLWFAKIFPYPWGIVRIHMRSREMDLCIIGFDSTALWVHHVFLSLSAILHPC